MTVDDLYALLGASMVDFREAVPSVSSVVLTLLRSQLAEEDSDRLTDFGIAVIDAELGARS